MKSILPIIICIVTVASLIVMPLGHGELPSKILAIICYIVCHICMWWAAIVSVYDDDRIKELERKIKELEEKNKNGKD